MENYWRRFDKKELERQYSPSRWSQRYPDPTGNLSVAKHIEFCKKEGESVRECIECQRNVAYGNGENCKLDIYGLEKADKDAPILVYIHGGYWQFLSRDLSAYPVRPLVNSGAIVVIMGYELAPRVSVSEILEQSNSAIKYTLQMAEDRGSRGVFIAGHCAGGLLATMALTVQSILSFDSLASHIKGIVSISGIYDLTPIVETYVNEALQLNEESALSLSPSHLLSEIGTSCRRLGTKFLVAVGEYDTTEFRRQSKEFQQELIGQGVDAKFIDASECDHFQIVENLTDTSFGLTKGIMHLMELSCTR